MPDPAPDSDLKRLLDAYDAQLREGAEMVSMTSFDRAGPLWRGKEGGRGFVSYRSLDGLTGPALDALIADTVAHYAADPDIQTFEWKTRGHDAPADLPQRLSTHGFQAQAVETVMVGEAALLAQPVPLPQGVTLRRIDDQPDPLPDVVRAAAAQEKAFGYGFGVGGYLRQIERSPDLFELWVAEAAGEIVCIGQLGVVPGSDFAGLWGGGTLPEWRGKGIYRALTAARARSALNRGVRYLHSDCTEYSRPILERSGLRRVTTTTPYVWTR
ncbi:GNAT family N-acetyltransferase [Deinococcus koreensis]|uniref:GNAT family N-acetyltransferase n=1 Tax=Deinococcus koreensis TaxID=2054903 RepID=A0A2K3UVQ2_9DEIO|nr:GNAT family N-acetyltransferase [Deinococcus koreensis]PNY80625.1 GNAT family N-acetyltransferase [Deinococcus koreensis]